jgi:hypothetical protein
MSCSSQQNQQQSPLLKLPGELRNRVYEYALGGTIWTVGCTTATGSYGVNYEDRTHQKSLPLTCRQLYLETILLVYSLKTFRLDSE